MRYSGNKHVVAGESIEFWSWASAISSGIRTAWIGCVISVGGGRESVLIGARGSAVIGWTLPFVLTNFTTASDHIPGLAVSLFGYSCFHDFGVFRYAHFFEVFFWSEIEKTPNSFACFFCSICRLGYFSVICFDGTMNFSNPEFLHKIVFVWHVFCKVFEEKRGFVFLEKVIIVRGFLPYFFTIFFQKKGEGKFCLFLLIWANWQ